MLVIKWEYWRENGSRRMSEHWTFLLNKTKTIVQQIGGNFYTQATMSGNAQMGFLKSFTMRLSIWDRSIQEWTKLNLWKTAFIKFEGTWSAWADHTPSNFLKTVFHKFYLVHSWILCLICWMCIFDRIETQSFLIESF